MKKKSLLIIVLLLIVSLFVGISYALWQLSHTQREHNYVSSGCFSVSSSLGTVDELEPINLVDTIPMDNEVGMTTTPFTFTLTNTCTTYAEYQINLETLETSTMPTSSLKAVINNETPKLLAYYPSVEATITNATSSNKLLTGGIKPNETLTFNLRIWVDVDSDMASTSNTTYEGKISIITVTEIKTVYGTDTIMNLVKGEPTNTLDVITKEAPDSSCTNTLAYDGTVDNNLRYVGSNPCNYVSFNDETWRIIGVMNNIDDGSGKKETRLKIIRNESLGNYSWDVSLKTINGGRGINQWGPSTDYTTNTVYPGADLMQELNGDYLNPNLTNSPMWYGYQSGYSDSNYRSGYGQNTEFDKTKVLSASAQELIGDAVWYTGAYNDTNIGSSAVTTPASYQNEKSDNPNATNNGKYCPSTNGGCNDTVIRTFTWTGKVALMNVSDYGYAVGGSVRSTCLTTNLSSYSSNSCNTNDWLFYGTWQWSLSPSAYTAVAVNVGSVDSDGGGNSGIASNDYAVRPAVYLLSSSQITEGNGSESKPFKFE